MGGLASRRIRRELCRAAEREGTPSGLHVGGPGRQLRHARQLPVHALERSRKELLAVQRLVDGTRKTSTPRLGFAAVLTLLLACQRALLVAQLSQADLQCLEPVQVVVVNLRMMREAQYLILLVIDETALEFA